MTDTPDDALDQGIPPTAPAPVDDALWLRRKGESAKAYSAFLLYRDLGPDRSLYQVAARLGKHVSLMKRWSSRRDWQARVQAWDQAEQRTAEQIARRAREAAYERRLTNAEQLEKVAMAGLRSLMVRDKDSGEVRFDPRLKPGDIASLIRVAAQIFPTPPPLVSTEEEGAPEALTRLRDDDIQVLLSLLQDHTKEDEHDE